jgi:hypothetical protein
MAPTYRATSLYPRIIWSGTSLDLEGLIGGPNGVAVGAVRIAKPDRAAVRSDRPAQFTARREVILGHLEEALSFTVQMVPGWKAKEIDRFLEEWGLPGKQFELYLDRFQGAALEFEGTLKDQQGTAGTFTGTPSYEAATFARGLRLDAGEFLDFPTAPTSQQPSLLASEGIVVLVVRPSFAGNDGVEHQITNMVTGLGRWAIRKDASNNLSMLVADSTGAVRKSEIAVLWSANSEQKIVGKWKDASSIEVWLNGVKGGAPTGAGTGIVVTPLPTNLRMGADEGGGTQSNGLYDRLGFFTRAFDLNASIVQALTDDYSPWWPNYFNKGELVDARVVPARPVAAREFYDYTMTIRKGAA